MANVKEERNLAVTRVKRTNHIMMILSSYGIIKNHPHLIRVKRRFTDRNCENVSQCVAV